MTREPDRRPGDGSLWQASLGLMIPSTMVSGPLVGFGLGWLIQRWTGWGVWVMIAMVLLGFAASVRETIRLIRKIG